eukprot:XP_020404499.1 U-box domain-containing protein 33 [Zea mays]
MEGEVVHIAVGKNTRKEEPNIRWAAAAFPEAAIVLVHVHWPSEWMPFMGGNPSYKFADEKEKERHGDTEATHMMKMFSVYKSQCGTRKVSAYYLTHRDVGAGVVTLVKKLKIKRIVIGSRFELDILIHNSILTSMIAWRPMEILDMEAAQIFWHLYANELGNAEWEDDTTAEEFIEKPSTCETEDFSNGEKAAKIMEEIDRLEKKLKELQGEVHNHEECSSLPAQTAAVSPKKCLAEPRYPELKIPEHIVQFSASQIQKATSDFRSENIIGEGGYGPVYKGDLEGIPVAIKSLRPDGKQGFSEYQHEVMVLSKLEHPHIVRLVGVCHASCTLVYEYLPNGTLLDRLSKGRLLPWEDRVRILVELRSALAYLHSHRPNAIIHADLKLANILLDAGDAARLGDFGTARMVHVKPLEDEEETIVRRTNPMGTMGYIDPVFFTTGELTTESDVYAFGVVILQLLTGLHGLNIAEQVRGARSKLHGLLDVSAGPWPQVHSARLLKLALRCCSLERKQRPLMTCDAQWKSLLVLRNKAAPPKKARKWNCFVC